MAREGRIIETGVPKLDLVLGGGVPRGDVLLVVGPAGSGKTTLTVQTAFHIAASGQTALYATTLSEPAPRLLRHIETYSFYEPRLVGKQLLLLSIYPVVKQGLENVTDALIERVKQQQATLLVIDGLMTLHDLAPSGGAEVRRLIYDLGAALSALDCTTFLTTSGTEESERHSPEFTMADGIVELGVERIGTRAVRTIEPRKMRGLNPLLGRHTLRIDGTGAAVFPRIESLAVHDDPGLSDERVPLGLAELDQMMNGGLPVGSTTVLAGALGAGKTLACLHFAMEGVRRGEKVLIAGLRETARQLVDKATVFGMDLGHAVENGQVVLYHYPAVDVVVDEVTDGLIEHIERLGPHRLVLDSYGDLEHALAEERRRAYMAALTRLLRHRGVTALITVETPQVPGPQLDFSDTPLAVLAQNFLLLRYVEFRGDLYRVISILKMRDSPFDASIRECLITGHGLSVRPVSHSPEGVLRGISRLPSQPYVRRRSRGGPE